MRGRVLINLGPAQPSRHAVHTFRTSIVATMVVMDRGLGEHDYDGDDWG
jgi:hypothetical protein